MNARHLNHFDFRCEEANLLDGRLPLAVARRTGVDPRQVLTNRRFAFTPLTEHVDVVNIVG